MKFDITAPILLVLLFFEKVDSKIGYSALGCWRDHSSTKSVFTSAIGLINNYLDTEDAKRPGGLLRKVFEVIWPVHEISEDTLYCIDDEYHGHVLLRTRKLYNKFMEGFREGVNNTLNVTMTIPRNRQDIKESLDNLLDLVSLAEPTFLKVHDIEQSSLFFREYSLLYLATLAEHINYCKTSCTPAQLTKWQNALAKHCYVFSKFSYWFLKSLPKRIADNIIFDPQKLSNNHLGLVNQISGKRLSEYDEPLSRCGTKDNNNCNDYTLGFLKAVRITARHRFEEYWKDLLKDFRQSLFKRHCTATACANDRYVELFVKAGDIVGLQYQAQNGENNQFCGSNFCSAMWMSTGGYKDYIYQRPCLGSELVMEDDARCRTDYWKICSGAGGCTGSSYLKNEEFPVALRSVENENCVDCSHTTTWCKQGSCPDYTNLPLLSETNLALCVRTADCTGPQFQLHNFKTGTGEPIEMLDEVHLSFGAPLDGHLRMLSGDIFSGAFLRTQFYMRLEHKFTVSSQRTGETHGPFYCPTDKLWSLMRIEEQAVCAQSSFTLVKKISEAQILSSRVPQMDPDTQGEPYSARLTDNELNNLINLPRTVKADDLSF